MFVFKLDIEMNLRIKPQDLTEGKRCEVQCTALLNFPSTGGSFTWKMKDTVATNGDRIDIKTDYNPTDANYTSWLTLNKSSWTDNGKRNLNTVTETSS